MSDQPTLATPRNMRAAAEKHGKRVRAFDPTSGSLVGISVDAGDGRLAGAVMTAARLLYATYPPHLLTTCVVCGNSPQTDGPSRIIHKFGCPRSDWATVDACTNDDTGEQETIYDSPHHNPERALALGWELDGDGSPIAPPFT